MEINQPKSVKLKMTGHKLRICGKWQGALKQKSVKQTEIKHGLWRRLIFKPVLQILRLVSSNSWHKHEMAKHYGRQNSLKG
jgi:hypothetical protein